MALQIKFSYEQSSDCKTVTITDTTGNYDADTNPTGWGAPNPAKTDVDEAELTIEKPDGNNVTIDLFALGYPVTGEIILTAVQVGYVTKWSDGEHTFTIALSGTFGNPPADFSSTYDICPFLVCQVCCCVQKKWIAGQVNDGKQIQREEVQDLFDIMMANINCGDADKASEVLVDLQKLCADCGCS